MLLVKDEARDRSALSDNDHEGRMDARHQQHCDQHLGKQSEIPQEQGSAKEKGEQSNRERLPLA